MCRRRDESWGRLERWEGKQTATIQSKRERERDISEEENKP